jgi:hypothetical protein
MSSIPEDLSSKNNNVLKNLDESVVRSVNGKPFFLFLPHVGSLILGVAAGTRLTDELLRLVPNVQVFGDALRCIKLWAQRAFSFPPPPCFTCGADSPSGKAIYSNKNGYLVGVAWAMLVVRICQLYPHAVAGAIVQRFFAVMSKWYGRSLPPSLKIDSTHTCRLHYADLDLQAMAPAGAAQANRGGPAAGARVESKVRRRARLGLAWRCEGKG